MFEEGSGSEKRRRIIAKTFSREKVDSYITVHITRKRLFTWKVAWSVCLDLSQLSVTQTLPIPALRARC